MCFRFSTGSAQTTIIDPKRVEGGFIYRVAGENACLRHVDGTSSTSSRALPYDTRNAIWVLPKKPPLHHLPTVCGHRGCMEHQFKSLL